MATEFEPFVNDAKKNEFNALDFDPVPEDVSPEVSIEEALIAENERLKQEAIQQGYAEGMANAQSEIDAKINELSKWIEILQKPTQLLDDRITQEIVQTIIWTCTHCIGVELTVNPDKLFDLLEEIKGELPSLKGNNLFCMHPDDISWAKNELSGKILPELEEILVSDSTLSRGDFYLKGDNRELDGKIHTRFVTLFAKYIDKDMLITPIMNQE